MNIFPDKELPLFIPTVNTVPCLEEQISMNELTQVLKKLTCNKAIGPDNIANEF